MFCMEREVTICEGKMVMFDDTLVLTVLFSCKTQAQDKKKYGTGGNILEMK